MRPSATAMRAVGSFSDTSTIRASPSAPTWVRRPAPSRRPGPSVRTPRDGRGRKANSIMARDPSIAYVLLRNAHFGPRLASSVELCVRDLGLYSRYARSTLVACPPVDGPFEGVEIATIPDVSVGGNVAKALGVARLLRRRGIDIAVVENHLPAASLIAATSGARVLLHSHAYETPPRGVAGAA